VVWIGARALTFVTLVLLARALPADGLGALLAALATGVLGAALAMGGLPDVTTRQAASATEEQFGRGDVRRSLVRFAATLPVIAALLVIIAYGSSGPVEAGLVVAGLLLAATQGATTIIASIFRARGQAGRFAIVTTFLVSAGRTVVAALALTADLSADAVLWTFVALNVAVIVATWRAAMAGLPDTESRSEGDGALQLGGVAWSLMGNLDVVIVGVVLGAGDAGRYGAALRLSEFSIQFLIALSVLYMPEATRLAVTNRLSALGALYRTTCRWSTIASVVMAGVGFIVAPALARLIFDGEPSTEIAVMRILFVGYAIHGAVGQTYSTLVAIGAYRDIRRCALVLLPAIVVGTAVLTAAFGQIGAAVATAVAYAGSAIWWAVLVQRRANARPFDAHYPRALVACAAAALAAAGAFHLTGDAPPLASLLAAGAVAIATVAVVLPLSGGLTRSELAVVARRLRLPLGRSAG
jgi:O-antigen/teichoic acid export membrane protein